MKFKVKVGTHGIWPCHFVPYLQGQHQATGARLKEFPCFFFFFPEKDDTKNRSTTLAERFSTSPSTSKSPVPQLHLLLLNLISTPHSQPSPSLRAGDGKRNVPLTLTVVQFHWKLTEAVDTPANSDGDTVIVKKDTSLPWLKCEFDGRDSVCALRACSAVTLGDGFWFSEKRNTNKHTHTQTICTVIYNAQSTILMHTHTDAHTAGISKLPSSFHLPSSSHSTPSVIRRRWTLTQCVKSGKERYVKADIPSNRAAAQRRKQQLNTPGTATHTSRLLFFMRSWQETLWNTRCSIYWSPNKSLSLPFWLRSPPKHNCPSQRSGFRSCLARFKFPAQKWRDS